MLSLDKNFQDEKNKEINIKSLSSLLNDSTENKINIKSRSKNNSKHKNIHKNTIKCLINCTLFKLNVTLNQGKTVVGYLFNNNYLTYFFPNLSTHHLLSLLKLKEENENFNINNKCNLKNLSESLMNDSNEKILSHEINFPIENFKHEKNQISIWDNPSLFLSYNENNTSCILIDIDLNNSKEKNKYFKEINNKFVDREILFYLNGIVHQKDLLKNDISFTIDKKKIIKSIQIRIENYKNSYLKQVKNKNELNFKFRSTFFTPLVNLKNIGILFCTNNKKELTNLSNLQTNIGSIISKKFILLKLFIGINIPNYIGNLSLNSEETVSTSNQTNSSKGIKTFSSDNDNINFIQFNTPLNKSISIRPHSLVKNNNSYICNSDFCKEKNPLIGSYENSFNKSNKNKFIRRGYSPINLNNNNIRRSYFPKKFLFKNEYILDKLELNLYSKNKQKKIILIDNEDKFANELYKKYKNKSGFITNFLIFKNLITINNNNSKDNYLEITIGQFFNNFINISSFGLTIPILNEYGKFSKVIYSPSLSSLVLYIKNNELYEIINKKINENINLTNPSFKNINNDINNSISNNELFIDNIKISLLNQVVKLEYNEIKPPFLRKTLNEKIEIILNKFPKLNLINLYDIDLNKSYFCILWNPFNSYENQTSFLTYYLFNSSLVGILTIKMNEYIWLTKFIVSNIEIGNIDESNLENEELKNNVEKLLFNERVYCQSLSIDFSFTGDYDFYLKNKFNF